MTGVCTPVISLRTSLARRKRGDSGGCKQPRILRVAPVQDSASEADSGRYIASESTFYRVLKEGTDDPSSPLKPREREKTPGS